MPPPRSVVALVPLIILPFTLLIKPQSEDPAVKSVHLFDLPSGVTEAELVDAMREVNVVVAELGYPEAGYSLWKARTEDPAYGYYWEGAWPSAGAYTSIHDHPKYRQATEAFADLYPRIEPVQTYVRYERVQGTGIGSTATRDFDQAVVEREVRAQFDEIVEAWEALEPEPYLDYFSADFSWLYEGVSIDRAALDRMVRSYMEGHAEADYTLETARVDVLGPEAAVFSGTFTLRQVDRAGQESGDRGAITFVMERRAGDWTVVHAHQSLPAPGPAEVGSGSR